VLSSVLPSCALLSQACIQASDALLLAIALGVRVDEVGERRRQPHRHHRVATGGRPPPSSFSFGVTNIDFAIYR
jgi:hypothetical protein